MILSGNSESRDVTMNLKFGLEVDEGFRAIRRYDWWNIYLELSPVEQILKELKEK
jgi:hypothetical protein